MESRIPKPTKSKVDLTVPVDLSLHKVSGGCFGKAWDMSTKECGKCADNELCGILFKEVVDQKAKAVEDNLGTKFLDTADFSRVTVEDVLSYIGDVGDGELTVQELLNYVMAKANCDDRKAAVEYVKRLVKVDNVIRTKEGLVWLK